MQGDRLSVPFGQMVLFVLINSFCLLFGRYKLGLLVSYGFVLYWGFIINRDFFVDRFSQSTLGLVVYALVGIAMVIIFIIGFFGQDQE